MTDNEILDPPGDETAGWDEVRVYFNDGSSTLMWVAQDDEIRDSIADFCDDEGIASEDVSDYNIL